MPTTPSLTGGRDGESTAIWQDCREGEVMESPRPATLARQQPRRHRRGQRRKRSGTTKQPNVLSALSFQVSYPICIQLRQDCHIRVLLRFESSRENDGSDSGKRGESALTACLDGKFEGSSAHQQRVKQRSSRVEIDVRIRANPVVLSVRTCDIAIQAHRNCITKFSRARAPAEQSSHPAEVHCFTKMDNGRESR